VSDLILSAFLLPYVLAQHLPPQCPEQTGWLFLKRSRLGERRVPPPQIYFAFLLFPDEGGWRNTGTSNLKELQ
jgi:hypothetical protein